MLTKYSQKSKLKHSLSELFAFYSKAQCLIVSQWFLTRGYSSKVHFMNNATSLTHKMNVYFFSMSPELLIAKSSRNISHWSLHNGYTNSFVKNVYPIRVFNARQSGTLIISLRVFKHDLEYLCRRDQGFKLILHSEWDYLFRQFFDSLFRFNEF